MDTHDTHQVPPNCLVLLQSFRVSPILDPCIQRSLSVGQAAFLLPMPLPIAGRCAFFVWAHITLVPTTICAVFSGKV